MHRPIEITNKFALDAECDTNLRSNVKEVFLKFANEKNLAPALLEKLGQVYNTAKTVNYLDKSAAKRGSSFEILDVSDMLETYSKEAKSDYSQNDIKSVSSERVPKDLFGGMTKDISLESSFDEQEIKKKHY